MHKEQLILKRRLNHVYLNLGVSKDPENVTSASCEANETKSELKSRSGLESRLGSTLSGVRWKGELPIVFAPHVSKYTYFCNLILPTQFFSSG